MRLILICLSFALAHATNPVSGGGFLNISSLTKNALPMQNAVEIYDMQQGASISTIYDVSGNGRDCAITGVAAGGGLLPGTATYAWRGLQGLTFLNGGFATCPTNILAGLGNTMTLVILARYNRTADWTRVWDCGTSSGGNGTNFAAFTLQSGGTGTPEFYTTTNGAALPWQLVGGSTAASKQFDTYVIVWAASSLKFYLNGVLKNTTASTLHPSDMTCVNQYIGKSQYSGDPAGFQDIGALAVYSDAWSAAQVSTVSAHLASVASLRAKFDVNSVSVVQTSTIIANVSSTWEALTMEPHPIQLGAEVWVYYAGWTVNSVAGVGAIGCASGPDLNHLTKCAGNPVVAGQTSVWPEISVSDPAILDMRNATVGTNAYNQCYMFYFGESGLGFEPAGSSIGAATSSDCKPPWTTVSTKVIACCSAPLDTSLWRFSAVYLDGTIHGYLNSGPTGSHERIYHVTATNPVGPYTTAVLAIDVGTAGTYDAYKAADPTVYFMNSTVNATGRQWMIDYSTMQTGSTDRGIGYAFSPDGVTWTKFAAGNPTIVGTSWRCRTFSDTNGQKHRVCDDFSGGPILIGDPWQ